MPWRDGSGQEAAIDHLMDRMGQGGFRPDGLLDRTLLAYPDAFGTDLAQPLAQARELVLRHGDARSRDLLSAARSPSARDQEIRRMRRILAKRPTAIEQASPALAFVGERMRVALPHAVPAGGRRLMVRIQAGLHPETLAYASATRIEPDADLLARWAALGHTAPPHSVWSCEAPGWCIVGPQISLAVEVAPNPSGFCDAMLVSQEGAARILALDRATDSDDAWRIGTVMPSGWSYLCGERTMGSSLPAMPNGAPCPATHIRVPDDDLFALCAARSFTAALRDSIWLSRRTDFRLLGGSATSNHGDNT